MGSDRESENCQYVQGCGSAQPRAPRILLKEPRESLEGQANRAGTQQKVALILSAGQKALEKTEALLPWKTLRVSHFPTGSTTAG